TCSIQNTMWENINALPAEELVKAILRGWQNIRRNYSAEIQKFQFSKQSKAEFQLLAQELHNQYSKFSQSSWKKLVLDPGILKDFYSVHVYSPDGYPVLAYPFHILVAEALDPTIFERILHHRPLTLREFILYYWKEKEKCQIKFSEVDLNLLDVLFRGVTTRSSINFPNAAEVRGGSKATFSSATARRRYNRLLRLGILIRYCVINHSRLGLVPVLKVYERAEDPSEVERVFSTWYSPLPAGRSVRVLVIPSRSSFWAEHVVSETNLLQFREYGVNFSLFDGCDWNLDFLMDYPNKLPNTGQLPLPQWQMPHTLDDSYLFRPSDLRLLTELQYTPERHIRHLGSRVGVHHNFVPHRLKELQQADIFQTYFQLYNVGLTIRFYLLAVGDSSELIRLNQLIRHLPQYYITRAKRSIFAVVRLSSEAQSLFINACLRLKQKMKLQEFHWSRINESAKTYLLNLPKVWNKKGNCWLSESPE
ncbi:MAG: hypothetical protein ACFFBD_26085, partial [Candidatus Hodarchaeota archaeon]